MKRDGHIHSPFVHMALRTHSTNILKSNFSSFHRYNIYRTRPIAQKFLIQPRNKIVA